MNTPRILIIGAGFSGAFTARHLIKAVRRGRAEVELINDKNYFVFQPLLPEVASGIINAQDAVTPLRVMLPEVRHRLAEVKRIDFDAKTVHVLQGRRRKLIAIKYDHLVLATGQSANLSRFPGLAEHSLAIKDLSDAFHLRNHVLQCLEFANVTCSAELKRMFLSFVVVGGGFSGVEVLGELQDMIHRALCYYPNIKTEEVRCILLQRGDCILPELPPQLSRYAHRKLGKRGVDILLHTGLKCATRTYVETDDGNKIPTMTIITTIGNAPTPLLAEHLQLQLQRGKVPVNRYLQVAHLDSVWAVGDAALVPLGTGLRAKKSGNKNGADDASLPCAPPTAQFAVREAHFLARNIIATLAGRRRRAFRYKARGMLASLGGYQGVAEIFGIRMSGILAWSIWRGFYMLKLPGFTTRVRVALNWIFDYFIPRTIVEIQQKSRSGVRFATFRKGDIVFERGELLDGFYLVLSGLLEVRTPNPDGGEDFVKTVQPQQHLGDRILSYDTMCRGTISALEDSRVMIMGWQDLVHLRQSFHMFDAYLREQSKEKYPQRYYGEM